MLDTTDAAPVTAAATSTSPVDNKSSIMIPAVSGSTEANTDAAVSLSNTTLHVSELDTSVDEGMLFELFGDCGSIASVRVCRDNTTRRSLGYAYVEFYHHSDGEHALKTLNNTKIKDRPCHITWSQRDSCPRKEEPGSIFIKNLDPAIKNKTLYELFVPFGKIQKCSILTNEAGKSNGTAFVRFKSRESVKLAIDKVNGMLLNNNKIDVSEDNTDEMR